MASRIFAAVALLALTFGWTGAARAEVRLALVIGNAQYRHVSPLDNALNDARLVAQTLRQQSFDVFAHEDLDQKSMKRAIAAFFGKASATTGDTVVLIYYAGHGLQLSGNNYLIPVDAQIDKEGDVDLEGIKVDSLMEQIEHAGPKLNIVILDACRNNPFRGFRSVSRGLAQVDAPGGTLVAFSTAPGRVARDGPKGANSPYTAELARAIVQPGLRIEDVFKKVRIAVNAATRGEQIPWESSSLVGDFYPAGQALSASPATPVDDKKSVASAISPSDGDRTQFGNIAGAVVSSPPAAASLRARQYQVKERTGIHGDLIDSKSATGAIACRAECDQHPACVAFDHSAQLNRCNLYRRVIATNPAQNWVATVSDAIAPAATANTAAAAALSPTIAAGPQMPKRSINGVLLDSQQNRTLNACEASCRDDARCQGYDFSTTLHRCNLYVRIISLQNSENDTARVLRGQ